MNHTRGVIVFLAVLLTAMGAATPGIGIQGAAGLLVIAFLVIAVPLGFVRWWLRWLADLGSRWTGCR